MGTPINTTLWGLTGLSGLIGFRWDLITGAGVNRFASVGFGPAYFRAKVDDGVTTIADGDWTFAYSGRAGVSFDDTDAVSLETGYRYLGTNQVGTPGFHSGEIGLNLRF